MMLQATGATSLVSNVGALYFSVGGMLLWVCNYDYEYGSQ